MKCISSTSQPPDRAELDPLTVLAIKHGTDKWGVHFYTPIYHDLFRNRRHRALRLLEIGVGGYGFKTVGGASLMMWADYFPNAQIVGIDLTEKQLPPHPRVTILQGSQDNVSFLQGVSKVYGPFDIVVDDGSHILQHVIASFHALFPLLADDGIYVIEDVQTAFSPEYGGSPTDGGATMGLARAILTYLNQSEIRVVDPTWSIPPFALQIRAMRAYHNLLVVEKGDNTQPSNAAYNLNNATAARALKTMECQTRRAPTPQGIANLSYVYTVGGDHTRACEVVNEALAKWPDDPNLLHAGFLAAGRRGDHQQRVDYLERLRRIEPENRN